MLKYLPSLFHFSPLTSPCYYLPPLTTHMNCILSSPSHITLLLTNPLTPIPPSVPGHPRGGAICPEQQRRAARDAGGQARPRTPGLHHQGAQGDGDVEGGALPHQPLTVPTPRTSHTKYGTTLNTRISSATVCSLPRRSVHTA